MVLFSVEALAEHPQAWNQNSPSQALPAIEANKQLVLIERSLDTAEAVMAKVDELSESNDVDATTRHQGKGLRHLINQGRAKLALSRLDVAEKLSREAMKLAAMISAKIPRKKRSQAYENDDEFNQRRAVRLINQTREIFERYTVSKIDPDAIDLKGGMSPDRIRDAIFEANELLENGDAKNAIDRIKPAFKSLRVLRTVLDLTESAAERAANEVTITDIETEIQRNQALLGLLQWQIDHDLKGYLTREDLLDFMRINRNNIVTAQELWARTKEASALNMLKNTSLALSEILARMGPQHQSPRSAISVDQTGQSPGESFPAFVNLEPVNQGDD